MLVPQDRRGFSLIELLIVLAMLGVMLLPLVSAFTRSIRYVETARKRKVASNLMWSCLSSIRSVASYSQLPTGSVDCVGQTRGDDPRAFRSNSNFEYETQVRTLTQDSGRSLKRIDIRVRYPSGDGMRCLTDVECKKWDATSVVSKR